ncbi:bifunctional metallophosphatase/5'-nucleotidase [Inconstantimicrobium mannanitabidum]|uniref:Metallophosphoesterase YunD n=1 Tax=Inconstantimicrobium mannanitabidum TaxID=1604901 RepID=A0ACB5RDC5_9CLOT|nr:5'-nucleotidase C-terminal domain-containing protein [Clostridium sp. TW13]GKX66766.1 putative metallophosphoesterase YunD [Clostridium sp. TW13]
MRFKILHTNDIHSNFENFAKIVTKINELKDENTIILDAGDFADFKRVELQGTNGIAAVDLLEAAKCDAISIGNNETFGGVDKLVNMATDGRVKFITSNMNMLEGGDIPGVKKSLIIEKNNIRFLIIGASPNIGEFSALCGLEIIDDIEAIRQEIDKNKGFYDVCIFLSHLGMDKDKEIANSIEEVDVIIGGHFHILMESPEVINGTIIHTSGQFGEHLGVLNIDIDENKVKLIDGENIKVETFDMNEDITDILKRDKEIAIENLSEPLYKLDKTLWHDVMEENPITNLLADGLYKMYECDLGIINSGILNGGFKKGKMTKLKFLQAAPSPLNPTYFEIEGRYLKAALEASFDDQVLLSDGRGPGFRGKYVGKLHVSNNVKILYRKRKIQDIIINGSSLEENKVYRVTSSDYLQRGSGYIALKNNNNVIYHEWYIRDLLEKELADEEMVNECFNDRWIEA